MEQITEDYVSFGTAKLLAEKGFNEDTMCVYIGRYLRIKSNGIICNNIELPIIPAPTLQMAMKWLRQVHNLHIRTAIFTDYADDADGNTVDEWCFWDYMIFPTSGGKAIYEHQEEVTGYGVEPDTCEGAQEAAIKYCLTNLID